MKTDSTQDIAMHWQAHIESWQQSDLSQTAYCKHHQLKPHRFSYWKRKLAGSSLLPVSQSQGFIQLVTEHRSSSMEDVSPLSIRLPGESVIEGVKENNVHLAVQLAGLLS